MFRLFVCLRWRDSGYTARGVFVFDRAELQGIWSGGHICLKLTSHAVCASADLGPRYMHDYVRSVDQYCSIPKVTEKLTVLGSTSSFWN
jgi:hypothetical protein